PIGNDGTGNTRATGIWVVPKPGNGISSAMKTTVATAAQEHWHVYIPISDRDNSASGRNLRYHVVNIAEFIVTNADCTGNNNEIDGQFVGFNWDPSQFGFTPGLYGAGDGRTGAVKSGHVLVQLGP